ncbi:hypothetical protein Ddc_02085 [Ditylenchus destructor]|nr:hypothetical protein Ddc_02085 [Ditylenchus destructor]
MAEIKAKDSLANALLRRKRKLDSENEKAQTSDKTHNGKNITKDSTANEKQTEEELRKKAADTLIREAQRSAQRADRMGPQGWLKPRPLNTNKNFLSRTLKSVEISRREHPEKKRDKSK